MLQIIIKMVNIFSCNIGNDQVKKHPNTYFNVCHRHAFIDSLARILRRLLKIVMKIQKCHKRFFSEYIHLGEIK